MAKSRAHLTDGDIDALAAQALGDWESFSRSTHKRIIKSMDLLVQNQRRMFDVMTGEQLARQGAFQQGVIFAYKRIAAMSQAALDETLNTEAVKTALYQEPPPPPARQGSLPDYMEFIDD